MKSRQRWISVPLALGLLLASVGPAVVAPPARVVEAAREVFTATITPSEIDVFGVMDVKDEADVSIGPGCQPGRRGLQGQPDEPATVGYRLDRSTDSAELGITQDCRNTRVYETRVSFDMNQFQKHPLAKDSKVSAFLSYSESAIARSEPSPRGSQGNTCVKDGFVATSDTPKRVANSLEDPPLFRVGAEIFRRAPGQDRLALNSDPWDLGEVARGWIDGSQENFGVVFVGFDETFNITNLGNCLSALHHIELQVIVVWEVVDLRAADLQVSNLVIKDNNGAPGCVTGIVDVTVTVRNAGNLHSGPPRPLLKVDGVGVEGIFTDGIRAGTSEEFTFTDVKLKAGKHTIEVVVDPDGETAESVENNNVVKGEVTCAVGAPEKVVLPAGLQITKFELAKSAAKPGCVAGRGNDFHIVVKNTGDVEIADILQVRLTVNGTANGTSSIGGVGAQSSKDSFVSNANLTAGTHTIAVTITGGQLTAASGQGTNSPSITVNCTAT